MTRPVAFLKSCLRDNSIQEVNCAKLRPELLLPQTKALPARRQRHRLPFWGSERQGRMPPCPRSTMLLREGTAQGTGHGSWCTREASHPPAQEHSVSELKVGHGARRQCLLTTCGLPSNRPPSPPTRGRAALPRSARASSYSRFFTSVTSPSLGAPRPVSTKDTCDLQTRR